MTLDNFKKLMNDFAALRIYPEPELTVPAGKVAYFVPRSGNPYALNVTKARIREIAEVYSIKLAEEDFPVDDKKPQGTPTGGYLVYVPLPNE